MLQVVPKRCSRDGLRLAREVAGRAFQSWLAQPGPALLDVPMQLVAPPFVSRRPWLVWRSIAPERSCTARVTMSGRWSKRIFLKEGKPVSKLDPRQTLITLPNEIPWQVPGVAPPDSVAEAVLVGAEEQEGT
jgi:hypothetical protein